MELRPVAKRARRLYLDSPELKRFDASRRLSQPHRRDFTRQAAAGLRIVENRAHLITKPQQLEVADAPKTVEAATTTDIDSEKIINTRKSNIKKALRGTASLAVITGAMMFGMAIQSRQPISNGGETKILGAQSSQTNNNDEDLHPDETKIVNKDIRSYQVASTMPKLLEIDKIGVKARILRTAQTKSGAVGVPRNIFDTSWYENSVIPGETGTSLIIGHNHGPTSEGVFWNLAKMSHGDTVKITYGSGLQKTFKVVSLESRKAQDVDMARILASTTSEAKLFLMSCSGKYDKTSDSYLDRLVVELNLVQ